MGLVAVKESLVDFYAQATEQLGIDLQDAKPYAEVKLFAGLV